MPHQCVKCGQMYDDGSTEILQGCKCGGKLFFYIKKSSLERKEEIIRLSRREKEQIEQDVYDILGTQIDTEIPIVLDIETINILKPGKYEIDLVSLFKKQPLIYRLEEGKYIVDLIESFKREIKKK
ncbi:MAG: Zn-ribbon domain-containing protein [Nanoarchaeota archaeon]|nr:Zn-ribbon domain-containing protein [Nanoarchaeota archaeon]MBU1269095.1 Zn-ribbon domain-containing protein [Nanoarchaeota archaeon]MBU1604499.1 Zn-ribbon domain-containing protein [Nanoarchaeota archaeon]MBU2442993.1 Zn-ribbon domain-containing protein [Nanoarchaeota archaeon]